MDTWLAEVNSAVVEIEATAVLAWARWTFLCVHGARDGMTAFSPDPRRSTGRWSDKARSRCVARRWKPYVQYGMLRVRETSCCGEYEWCCEGGLYVVPRRDGGTYEATPRSRCAGARAAWEALIRNRRHPSRRQQDGRLTSSGCDRTRP